MFLDRIFRGFPDFRGKRRMMNFLFRDYIDKSRDLVIKGHFNCKYLLPNIKETISFEIFCNGIYESETNVFLCNIIPRNGIFLDLGANIGSVAIPLIRRRPDVKCICVEAAPWIFHYLEKNKQLNFDNGAITLINKALLDKDDVVLPFYSPKEKFGKGSLSPVFTTEGIPVNSVTVDTIVKLQQLPRVDTIKIDIEGYEYFAFKGAEKLLSGTDAPDILFEFVDWAEERAELPHGKAQQYLLELGYNLYVLQNGKLKKADQILTSGTEMLFASKKHHNFALK